MLLEYCAKYVCDHCKAINFVYISVGDCATTDDEGYKCWKCGTPESFLDDPERDGWDSPEDYPEGCETIS